MDRQRNDEISRRAVWTALTHPLRRELVACLEEGNARTVESVAESVAATTEGRRCGDTGLEDLDRIEVVLHHHHLPLLADVGVVDYDPDEHTVRPSETIERVSEQVASLERANGETDDGAPW